MFGSACFAPSKSKAASSAREGPTKSSIQLLLEEEAKEQARKHQEALGLVTGGETGIAVDVDAAAAAASAAVEFVPKPPTFPSVTRTDATPIKTIEVKKADNASDADTKLQVQWFAIDEPNAPLDARVWNEEKSPSDLLHILEDANPENYPRINVPCPFPARAVGSKAEHTFVMPSFMPRAVTCQYGWSAKSNTQCMGRVLDQANAFALSPDEKRRREDVVDDDDVVFDDAVTLDDVQLWGVDKEEDLILNGTDLLSSVHFDAETPSERSAAHAILLSSRVIHRSNPTDRFEVRTAFPMELINGNVCISDMTTNDVVSNAVDRKHYKTVDVGSGDYDATLYQVDDAPSWCSPESFRWRHMCEKDFEDAIHNPVKIDDVTHPNYDVAEEKWKDGTTPVTRDISILRSRGNPAVECVIITLDYDLAKPNLLKFLVFSYAHDIRDVYDAKGYARDDLVKDEKNCIYVRTDVIMEVVRHHVKLTQDGTMVNLRDSFLCVRPSGVGAKWRNRVPQPLKQYDFNVVVQYSLLVLPTQCPLRDPWRFNNTLAEIKHALKAVDEAAAARAEEDRA